MLSTNSARLISGARRTASGHCGTQCGKHEGDDWRPMKSVRLIARLDIKGPNVIKGVHLEGLRVIGDPQEYARRYYEQGADELLYVDVVASLYGRSKLTEIVRRAAHDVFVPMTVAGGIRSIEDVDELLRAGADKVAINTAAVRRPELIADVARRFGSQCMVLSIEAKRRTPGSWEVYTDCGREQSGLDAVAWARLAVNLGAGEILVTSIDREGTRKGFEVELIRAISDAVVVPVIASGGYGQVQHLVDVVGWGADAVAVADALHYGRTTLIEIRAAARAAGVHVRTI
jgi:cyclase